MKDQTTLAYINMYAVLKDLEVLCELDDEAKAIAKTKKPISIGFNVTDGPKATLFFENGSCKMKEGLEGKIKLKLSSPEHLNLMVDGAKNPLPYGGFTKLSFLLKDFTKLTDIMTKYLKASDDDLKNRAFYEKSTTMMFYLVANALSAIGNYDKLGAISASKIPDGTIALEVGGGPSAEIVVKNGKMTTNNHKAENPRSYMIFGSYEVARGLFEGTVDAMSALAAGDVVMRGFIPMIDNLNKLLSRVAIYLG
ncbi:MAG: hypothetical protein RSD39_03495 [Oscillospiraceae bacterium]